VTVPAPIALYLTYWSLRDPLCQSQSLPYLRDLADAGRGIALVTYEQARFKLDPDSERREQARLAGQGIVWHPLTYHAGSGLLAKALDLCLGVAAGLRLVLGHRLRIVHARGSIAAIVGAAVASISGRRFLYDADSPISEEYADTGYWRRESLACRLTMKGEDFALRRADAVVTLTNRRAREMVDARGSSVPVTAIPCCVDVDRFAAAAGSRAAQRERLGAGTRRVLVYLGKLGPRYLTGDLFRFAAVVSRAHDAMVLVLSQDAPGPFVEQAVAAGLDPSSVRVIHAAPEDVPAWLSAGDAGLAFVNPTPVERASSPIKVAEYLAAGLPVVITPGIGDFSSRLDAEGAGVTISALDDGALAEGATQLAHLWKDGESLRSRCQAFARDRLSVTASAAPRYRGVYTQLLART
jgi:glycosyltransferase involved in cell wall biosynthesis